MAFVVCAANGTDSAAYTAPYIAGWSAGDVKKVKASAAHDERLRRIRRRHRQHRALGSTTSATSEPLDATSELARTANGLATSCRLGATTGMAATAA